MGGGGEAGGPPGDLRIEVTVRPHPVFTRKENDIYVDLPVTFGEAALGAKIEVPTIDGSSVMTIPAGTQGGQKFKLSGKGFPSPRTAGRGNQYVIAKIVVPKDINSRAKDAIKEIEALYKERSEKRYYREKAMTERDKKAACICDKRCGADAGAHPQTLRMYEREGFVIPRRTKRLRLYSEEDVERLNFVLSLTKELGVNKAGVDIILRMRHRGEALQHEMEEMMRLLDEDMKHDFEERIRRIFQEEE